MATARMTQVAPGRDGSPLASTISGRYSVSKFLDLHDFTARSSPWRIAWILMKIPLPGLIAALLPALLPLQPLRDGPTVAFFAHVFCIVVFIAWGSTVPILTVCQIPASVYSTRDAYLIGLCCGVFHLSFIVPLCLLWRFPVPFMWIIGTCFWTVSIMLAHLLVLRAKCWHPDGILPALKRNQVSMSLELSQVTLYPAISILFDRSSPTVRILITIAFPFIKFALKKSLQLTTKHLQDQHSVVVVSAVEICASLYQSMLMQSSPSAITITVIMALDAAQGLYAIKYFMDRHSINHHVPQRVLVGRALELLQTHRLPTLRILQPGTSAHTTALVLPTCEEPLDETPDDTSITEETRTVSTLASITLYARTLSSARIKRFSTSNGSVIREALKLTQAAETIVLLEYFEVMVPLVNCVFAVIAAQFQAAQYSTKLRPFYTHPDKLVAAVGSMALYSLLQGLSCVVMHVVMKHRYGLSASYQLAFVLERHRQPIQAKMVAWLPIILHFTTAHYGTDFSFQFAYNTWPQW